MTRFCLLYHAKTLYFRRATSVERLAKCFILLSTRGHGLNCFSSRKGAKNRKEDLITHVDIICHYSNEFDTTILYLHRLRSGYFRSVIKSQYRVKSCISSVDETKILCSGEF